MGFDLKRYLFKPEKETITFKMVNGWVEDHEDTIPLIDDRITRFVEDIDKQLIILENIDVEDKQSDERVKAITMGNLEKYIIHVNNLKNKLDDLESCKEIDTILMNFYQKSETNYQKATLLIGKELGDTRNTIGSFGQFLKKNAKVINEYKARAEIKEKLGIIENNDDTRKKVKNGIKEIKTKIEKKEEEEKQIRIKIEKNNEETKEQQTAYKEKIKENKKKIHTIKTLIDFKKLSSTFHSSKQMKTVREYKENFEINFQDDKKTILKLLEEAKMPTKEIRAIMATVKEPKPPKIKASPIIREHNLYKEKAREEKRLEKMQQEKEALKRSIQTDLERMDVILEL